MSGAAYTFVEALLWCGTRDHVDLRILCVSESNILVWLNRKSRPTFVTSTSFLPSMPIFTGDLSCIRSGKTRRFQQLGFRSLKHDHAV